MAPKNPGLRSLFRRVAGFVIVLMAVAVPAFALNLNSSTSSGNSYSFGNPLMGNFGGSGFYAGSGSTDLFNINAHGGASLDLGCGAITLNDFMSTTFNVQGFLTQAQSAMQTAAAKFVMTEMMSFPQIAAAMDAMNGMLNARFSMFQQSCNMNDIQKDAKQWYYQRECAPQGIPQNVCDQQYSATSSSVASTINSMTGIICQYAQDPARNLNNLFCPEGNATHCAANDILPHFSMPVSACAQAQNKSYAPPLSAVGISAAMGKYTTNTMERSARVWDQILSNNASITPAVLHAIAVRASQLAAQASQQAQGQSYIPPANGKVQLAMTDMRFLPKAFGDNAQSATGILDEYNKQELVGCSPASMGNALLMSTYVAQAANEVGPQSIPNWVAIDTNVTYTDDLKVNAADFFSFGADAQAGLAQAGMDNQTAAKMLENTFACAVNGQLHGNPDLQVTSPALQYEIVTHGRDKWDSAGRLLSRQVMCEGVNAVLGFMKDKISAAKAKAAQNTATFATAKTTDASGNATGGDKLPDDTARQIVNGYLDAARDSIARQLEVNRQHCPAADVTGSQLRQLLSNGSINSL